MRFDRGFFIVDKLQENLFSVDDTTNDKIVMVYSELIRKASFRNDESKGTVNCKLLNTLYEIFGRKSMSRYLEKLEAAGLIAVLSKAKNGRDLGCIKIIQYEESQHLRNYCASRAADTDSVGEGCRVESETKPSNNKEKLPFKNAPVQTETRQSPIKVEVPACSSYIEEQQNRKNRSNRITNMVDASDPLPIEIDQLPTETNFNEPPPKSDSLALALSKPVKIAHSKKDVPPEGKSVETVNAYKAAYKAKYGVNPIINAATRKQACNLVDSVGKDAAPKLAEFYLTHHGQWYVKNLHKFGLLLSDAEKLHTEMQRGEYMTETMARKVDKDTHTGGENEAMIKKIESGFFHS